MLQADLQDRIKMLEEAIAQLLDQIESIDQDIDILRRATVALDRTDSSGLGGLIDAQGRDPNQELLAGEPSTIAGCATMIEACETWADAHDGLVRLTPLAREILLVGLSRAHTTASVSATIHGYLKKRAHDWEHVSPGVWRRRATQNGMANDREGDPSVVVGSCESEAGGEMTMT